MTKFRIVEDRCKVCGRVELKGLNKGVSYYHRSSCSYCLGKVIRKVIRCEDGVLVVYSIRKGMDESK